MKTMVLISNFPSSCKTLAMYTKIYNHNNVKNLGLALTQMTDMLFQPTDNEEKINFPPIQIHSKSKQKEVLTNQYYYIPVNCISNQCISTHPMLHKFNITTSTSLPMT